MLEELKVFFGIEADDHDADNLITLIISKTTQRLKNKLGNVDPPAELDYIVFEVAVKRFNRIGSEGLTSHTVEGESLAFADSDFDEFKDDIADWLDRQDSGNPYKGGFKFI